MLILTLFYIFFYGRQYYEDTDWSYLARCYFDARLQANVSMLVAERIIYSSEWIFYIIWI